MNKLKIIVSATLISITTLLSAQTELLGRWVTIDDQNGMEKSVVKIYKSTDGKYYGKIESLLVKGYEDMLCTECKGDLHNQPVAGMVIIREMEYIDGKLCHGSVLDPENGKTYYGKIWYDSEKKRLILRGSLDRRGIFGRNQEWKREQKAAK